VTAAAGLGVHLAAVPRAASVVDVPPGAGPTALERAVRQAVLVRADVVDPPWGRLPDVGSTPDRTCVRMVVMRWDAQRLDADEHGTLPGMPTMRGLLRSVQVSDSRG
jgi:hypothetical protein